MIPEQPPLQARPSSCSRAPCRNRPTNLRQRQYRRQTFGSLHPAGGGRMKEGSVETFDTSIGTFVTAKRGVYPPDRWDTPFNKVTKVTKASVMEMDDPYRLGEQIKFDALTFLQSIYN